MGILLERQLLVKKFLSLIGMKFGRLTVVKRTGKDKYHHAICLCKCECGKEVEVLESSLVSGNTLSCGCYHKDLLKIESGLATKRFIFGHYKHHAKKRNILFELSFEQFLSLTQQNCHYCGIGPSNIKTSKSNNGDFIYNGIDRIDNMQGYTLDNCVPCCDQCNRSKRGLTKKEFMKWITNLIDHQKR